MTVSISDSSENLQKLIDVVHNKYMQVCCSGIFKE